MLVSVGYSQTSENSIGKISEADRAELVTLAEKAKDEVIESRQLVKAYEETLQVYSDALAKAEAEGKLSDQQIALQKAEIAKLRDALASERTALAKKELEAKAYQTALAKEVKKKNFYKNLAKVLTVTTGILVAGAAMVILKN
jgi:hypothetical protein